MHSMFEARRRGEIGDTILFVEHEPVITLGRGAKAPHLLASAEELARQGVELVSTGRGGDITLHGPGQLVAYPILDLDPDRRDVRRYVKDLAKVMQLLVADHGVAAGLFDRYVGLWVDADSPGVWSGGEAARSPAKIGAIGVRISRWITMHGFALNLDIDLGWFRLIVPCGISEYPVVSLASMLGQAPTVERAAERAFELFCDARSSPPGPKATSAAKHWAMVGLPWPTARDANACSPSWCCRQSCSACWC
jgi:lipoyl(octanoyl) transferase